MCLNSKSKRSPVYKSEAWPWIGSETAHVLMKAIGVKMGLTSYELNLTLLPGPKWRSTHVSFFSLPRCVSLSTEFHIMLARTLAR